MGKHLSIFLKVLVGLLFLAGIGLYLFRLPILDTLIVGQLTRLGVPVQSFKVEEVSLNALELGRLSLGTENELRAEKINATWTLQGLFGGELQTIEIRGLQLLLDLTGEKPPLGSLQKLIESEGGSGNNKIPQVSLLDTKVDLHTTLGDITVNLDGNIKPGLSDKNLIAINYETIAKSGHAMGEFTATLEATGKLQGKLTVSEATLSLPGLNISGLRGNSSFEWNDNQPQAITADIVLSRIGLPGSALQDEAFEQANISLQMDATDATIKAQLSTIENSPELVFAVMLQDYLHQPSIAVDVTAEMSAKSVIWRLFHLPQPNKGSASLTVKVDGKTAALRTAADNWQSWLQHSALQGQGILGLDGLGFTQKIADLNGDVVLTTELADGLGRVTLTEGSSFEASGLDIDWIKSLGMPAALIAELKQDTKLHIKSKGENSANITVGMNVDGIQIDLVAGLELGVDKAQADISAQAEVAISQQNEVEAFTLSEIDISSSGFKYAGNTINRLTLSGNLQGSAETWTGELDLATDIKRFRLGELDVRRASADLPMLVSFKDQSGQMSLRKPGQITVGKLAAFKSFRITGPLKLRLPRSDIEFTPEPQGLSLESKITAHPSNFTLLVNRDDAPALEMKIRPGKIVHKSKMESTGQFNGKSTISAAGITLPEYQIQLEKMSATIRHGETGKRKFADFRVGRLQHLSPKPYFEPVSLVGTAKLKRQRLSINASGGIPGTQHLKLTVVHDLDTAAGKLKLDVNPLTFSPGALQPAALFPDLVMLESVTGNAGASNHVSWSKQGIKSGAAIDLQNLSFTQNGTTINKLSAALELTDLLSLKSPPQQKLTIQRIDSGVAMEDVEITYQIQGTDSPQIAIDKASLSMIGGTLSTGHTVIDPLSSTTHIKVHVADLDLEALFNMIDVEGLAGDGRLDGSIPLSFSDDSVSIQNGELAATKPGILRFKSEKVSKLLAGRAEDVDLLIQALTEFHYSELTLKLNNSINNDLVVNLSLLGNNPKVLKGRPFRLNINLESNIGSILKALAQGYGLSNKAIQRAFRLR